MNILEDLNQSYEKIIHVISMKRGLGGVQQSFLSYYKYANKFSDLSNLFIATIINHQIMKLEKFF